MTRLLSNDGASEGQYLDLIRLIKSDGIVRGDRTGVGTVGIHGHTLRFDLSDGTIPLLTTKRVAFRKVIYELLWFLNGSTNIRPLLENDVHIWSEWPHARFMKGTGQDIALEEFEAQVLADQDFANQWGDLGPVYGKQWRRWEGPDGRVYDQLADVVERIKRDPDSRRLLFHGWNVAEIDQMALPPCHLLYQFYVANGRLSMTLYQRSVDVGLGLPFNIASAAILIRMVAQQCSLEPGSLFWVGHDVHLYKNHLDIISTQLDRTPRPFPRLKLKGIPASLFDYQMENFAVLGYSPDPTISMPVAV
jgi:thymidylate synthase